MHPHYTCPVLFVFKYNKSLNAQLTEMVYSPHFLISERPDSLTLLQLTLLIEM